MKKLLFILLLQLVVILSISADDKVKRPETYNYSRGLEELGKDNLDEALTYFNKEINENPKNGYAHAWMGTIYVNKSEFGRALKALNLALKNLPKKDSDFMSSTYNVRGGVYFALKDTVNGLADYAMAIKLAPNEEANYSHRAQIYYELKDYEKADQDYRSIIRIDETSVMGYMGIGRNRLDQERWDEAIEQFNHVVELYSDYSSAYSYRAEAYIGMKEWNKATDDIISALIIDQDSKAFYMMQNLGDEARDMLIAKLKIQSAKNPNVASWPYSIGVIYHRAEQYGKAIEWYEKSNSIDSSSESLSNIVDCQMCQRHLSEALSAINKAINLDNTDASLYIKKADILFEKEEITDCQNIWNQLVDAYPESVSLYYRRGCFLYSINDVKGALDDFNMAVMLAPESSFAYVMRADVYNASGEKEKAIADYQKVIDLETKEGSYDRAMYAYAYLGENEKAIGILDSILAKSQDISSDYYDAACLYSRMKNKEMAFYYLEKSLENGYNHFTHISRDYDMDYLRTFPTEYKTLINKYSRTVVVSSGVFEVQGDDGTFSGGNSNEDGASMLDPVKGESEIPFTKENGICRVKCQINDLPLYFVFDTGAATVSLSMVEASFMLKNGYLTKRDAVGSNYFVDANGDISEGSVFNLRKVVFGGYTLENVKASVVKNQRAPLLLGQSVLGRLGSVEIDNQKSVIRIKNNN